MLAAEYAKTLVADLAHACLARADLRSRGTAAAVAGAVAGATKAKGAGRRGGPDAGAAAAADTSAYPLGRVVGDVEQVLAGLGTARSAQLQASCLTLLRELIRAHPAAAALAVRVLGALLSSPAMGAQVRAVLCAMRVVGGARRRLTSVPASMC